MADQPKHLKYDYSKKRRTRRAIRLRHQQASQYIYGADSSQTFTLRKYNAVAQTYSKVPGASISFVTVNGQSAAKVVYSVTDGSTQDDDGLGNGVIVDPVGLAIATVPQTSSSAPTPGLPNTGFEPSDSPK